MLYLVLSTLFFNENLCIMKIFPQLLNLFLTVCCKSHLVILILNAKEDEEEKEYNNVGL